jgi:hypothetical protein
MKEPKEPNLAIPLIIGCFSLLALVFGSIAWKNTFGVADANADRHIYQESASYIDGKNQLIAKLRHDYLALTDLDSKKGLANYVRQEASSIDLSKLTEENRNFVKSLK